MCLGSILALLVNQVTAAGQTVQNKQELAHLRVAAVHSPRRLLRLYGPVQERVRHVLHERIQPRVGVARGRRLHEAHDGLRACHQRAQGLLSCTFIFSCMDSE